MKASACGCMVDTDTCAVMLLSAGSCGDGGPLAASRGGLDECLSQVALPAEGGLYERLSKVALPAEGGLDECLSQEAVPVVPPAQQQAEWP